MIHLELVLHLAGRLTEGNHSYGEEGGAEEGRAYQVRQADGGGGGGVVQLCLS